MDPEHDLSAPAATVEAEICATCDLVRVPREWGLRADLDDGHGQLSGYEAVRLANTMMFDKYWWVVGSNAPPHVTRWRAANPAFA